MLVFRWKFVENFIGPVAMDVADTRSVVAAAVLAATVAAKLRLGYSIATRTFLWVRGGFKGFTLRCSLLF